MARKNNRRNHRRAAYYYINQFDYKAREKLAEGKPSPKEIPQEEKVEHSPGNAWIKA